MIHDLINSGIELNVDGYEQNERYDEWLRNCASTLGTLFGSRYANEVHQFRRAGSINERLLVLKAAQYTLEKNIKNTSPVKSSTIVNVNQLQSTSIHNEITFNIMLNIDYSDLSDKEKEEAKELYAEVTAEVQKTETNWERVRTLLRRSFDYGLKVAPDIIKMADAYFRAKGGK